MRCKRILISEALKRYHFKLLLFRHKMSSQLYLDRRVTYEQNWAPLLEQPRHP